jgi:hypothetical protein
MEYSSFTVGDGRSEEEPVVIGPGFNCRAACKTKNHLTYAECMRAAHIGVGRGESAPAQFA